DFAWTAWEGAFEVSDTFRVDGLPEVVLTALVPEDARASAPHILAAAKATLEHGGRHWLPYPYPHLTLVAPPIGATYDSGGMEYPTFATVFTRTVPVQPRDFTVWEVTIHEVAHNWWQGMVASNESEEAWLDEGVDTWATYEVLQASGLNWDLSEFAAPGMRWLLHPFLHSAIPERDLRGSVATARFESTVVRPSWRFRGGYEYNRSAYGRGANALEMLEREMGPETFARAMRTYAERWAFRHPGTDDFLDVVSEVSGRDLRPLGNALLRGTAGLDDTVTELRCKRVTVEGGPGYYEDGGTPVFRAAQRPGADAGVERCEVLVERKGDLAVPLDVQLTFSDGSKVREKVPDGELWHRFTTERADRATVDVAEVHPGSPPPVDSNPLNDARSRTAT